MEISAKEVMSLRARTGVSMMDCKAALLEAGGDSEKAIDVLKRKGAAKAAKKSERETHEGRVSVVVQDGKASIAAVLCETDFVSRNENFIKLSQDVAQMAFDKGEGARSDAEAKVQEAVTSMGENLKLAELKVLQGKVIGSYVHTNGKIGVIVILDGGDEAKARDVAMHSAAMSPTYVSPNDVSADEVAKEKEIWIEQLKNEGKPEAVVEKILVGKEKKYREENALLTQAFVKDQNMTVEQYLAGVNVVEMVRVAV